MPPITVTPRLQKRITGTLFSTESLFSAAYIASVTLLSINASQLGGGDALAGVPGTVALLGRAAIAMPMGWLMDRRGRRDAITLGYLFGVLGLLLGGLAVGWASFLFLCLGAGLAGMANGTSQQTRFVASEVWPQDHRARIIGFIVFAGTVGAICGPLLVAPAVAWATHAGLAPNTGPYFVGAGLTFGACLLTFLLLRPDPKLLSHALETAPGTITSDLVRPLAEIFARPMVQLAVASMVVGQLVMNLIMVITPVYMNHQNHSTGEISLVFMAHTLGMFGFSTVTGWLIDHLGTLPMIAYGAFLLVAASILAPLAANVLALAVALFVLGLGWNFCFVAGSTLLSGELHSAERGRVQGVNDMLVALASATGSLATGVIFAMRGMVGIGAVGLALTLIFAVIAAWLVRRRQHDGSGWTIDRITLCLRSQRCKSRKTTKSASTCFSTASTRSPSL